MRELTFMAPTKRRSMTKARAAKVFLREQGRCYKCNLRLSAGVHGYEIEHQDALALGGPDEDEFLKVICLDCHKAKTAEDRKKISKRNNAVTSTWKGKRKKKMPYRRFNGERVWPE